ncbi:substrate-binding domain-containing protein [Chromobacterium alticapitis]|uniref:PBP domain-containing protein n=1 Tax=Chromobacterium alticapitis TaxID=2073169 RepID=A0A2S5DGS7_9NEIS|nr:substrate-binding domain-containing protein [Chromobacterium alticapitis]POZ62295.1 hypothetical protein C2I19_09000 [Chromobacterium alticapitis]
MPRFLALLCAAHCAAAYAAPQPALQLRGATALLPLMQRAAENYMAREPGSSVVVASGSSAFGVKSLLDGSADIAMVHGAIPQSLQTPLRKDQAWQPLVVGYQALIPVAHPDNPVSDISLAQLRAVFSGAISNWRELGGTDSPITVLVDPPAGGAGLAWREVVLGADGRFSPRSVLLPRRDWVAQLARHPEGIAIVGADELSPGLKRLTLSGQRADAAAVSSGRYPLRIPLLLLTARPPAPACAAFLRSLAAPRQDGAYR